MSGASVVLGPFAGGLNTQSDPSMVSEQELVECINFEVDLDGGLRSRPPVVRLADTPAGNRMLLLGFAYLMEGTYLIGSCSAGLYARNTAGVWNLITNTIQSTQMAQFRNNVWLPANPGSVSPGGWWHPNSGWNPIAAMPKGQAILSHKGRLYIAPGLTATTNRSRLYFSGSSGTGDSLILDPTIWDTVNDYLDVNEGDGQILVDIIVFNDSIVCLKENSTYVFAFDTSPKAGVVRKVNGTIGASRERCVVLYENNMYVYHAGEVYEVVNFDYQRINAKVPFVYEANANLSEPGSLSLMADRLVLRFFNKVYVFGMRTRSWTEWKSALYFGYIVAGPRQPTIDANDVFYAGSAITTENRFYQINDGYDATSAEEMTCTVKTKNYDMGSSFRYKRLFYWGCDILSIDDVTGIVTPVVAPVSIPAPEPPDINDIQLVGTGGTGSPLPVRSFLKFLKAMRFRQINFQVKMTTDGTLSRGPVRLFSITAFVRQKENAVKEAS